MERLADQGQDPDPDHDPAPDPDSPDAPPPPPRPQRRYREMHYLFARLAVTRGTADPVALAKEAGFSRPWRGPQILLDLQDLIAQTRLHLLMGEQMELHEALKELAGVARQSDDLKTKHSALRTILEVHGALSNRSGSGDRSSIAKQIEEIVGEIKGITNMNTTVNVGVNVNVGDRDRDRDRDRDQAPEISTTMVEDQQSSD